jgi:hypothetical protein
MERRVKRNQFIEQLLIGVVFISLPLVHPTPFIVSAAVGYFVILADSFFAERSYQEQMINFSVASALVVFLLIFLPLAGLLEGILRPATIDPLFRALDLRMGIDAFALSRFYLAHKWAWWTTQIVYGTLPLAMAIAWVLSHSRTLLRVCLVAPILAFPCYLLFPGGGPAYVYHNWPAANAYFVSFLPAASPRNCMPLMHFTWAALLILNVPRRWRAPFIVYTILMAFAVVAGGEHWAVDVVAAIPFALVVQWACTRNAAPVGSKVLPVPGHYQDA